MASCRASGASTPQRKSHVQQNARSDYFFPGEVESYRHASEAQLAMPLSKLRVPVRRATQLGLSGEQEVVWLDDEGMEVSAPPGAPSRLVQPCPSIAVLLDSGNLECMATPRVLAS